MKIFWLRLVIFCLLFVGMIYTDVDQASISYSLLFFTCALALFFFLSTGKHLLILYLGITIIICMHHFIVLETYSFFSLLLLLFVTIVATFKLTRSHIIFYSLTNLVLSIMISFRYENDRTIEMIMFSLFFYFLVLTVNRMTVERDQQKKTYDKLSGEFRRLKRLTLRTEEAARIEERTKIARDIHDSVGHRLTALIMKLEMLSIQNPDRNYDDLKQMTSESLEDTREAVKALQAEENEGISTVVHLIRKLEAESHILVQFTTRQGVLSVTLYNEKSVVLYRVIQEALTNAMRHAQTREIHVILGRSANGDIAFEISNQQFEAKAYELGFGLTNMEARINQVNGTLHIYQTEKQFVVSGTIPSQE